MNERRRILKALIDLSTPVGREFSYKDVSVRANAYCSNVSKLVRRLVSDGIVVRIGGRGVAGDPLRFKVTDQERLKSCAKSAQ